MQGVHSLYYLRVYLYVPVVQSVTRSATASGKARGGSEPWALGGGLAAMGAGVDARRSAAVSLGEHLPLA